MRILQQGSSGTVEGVRQISSILVLGIGDMVRNLRWTHQHYSSRGSSKNYYDRNYFKTDGAEFIVDRIVKNKAHLRCAKPNCEATQGPIDSTRSWDPESPIPELLDLTWVES